MIGVYFTLIDDAEEKVVFKSLYETQKNKLIGLAFKILGDKALAEDAVSEAFLCVAKRFSKLEKHSFDQLKAYCAVAVKNICSSMLKENARKPETDIENIKDKDFMTDSELSMIDSIFLKQKISELKYNDKEILTLYYFYDMSLREISSLKRISCFAAQKRLQLARKHLALLVKGE